MTELRQMRGSRVAWLVALQLLSCDGTAFQLARSGEDAATSIPYPKDGALTDSGPTETADSEIYSSDCGVLRSRHSPHHQLEICLTPSDFMMGSNSPNFGSGFADHTPAHQVTIDPFILDGYEVTVARYRRCVLSGACEAPKTDNSGCTFQLEPGEHDNRPVTCISWHSAAAFCSWDEERRLPTEAEWEFAARGESATSYPWGDVFSCSFAVIGAASSCPAHELLTPQQVGSHPEGNSAAGVADLTGNAAEWVADWLAAYPKQPVRAPQGPIAGTAKVLRGGSWQNRIERGLGYARASASPLAQGLWGFRCARDSPDRAASPDETE